jgi:hypothetical protein
MIISGIGAMLPGGDNRKRTPNLPQHYHILMLSLGLVVKLSLAEKNKAKPKH